MKNLGIKAYRFSLNWARILPEGTGRVNEKAVSMYRDMILTMKENGITPYITLFHWEFPQALQEKGGWLNEEVVDWFGEYAKVVAENFSDLCEYFITINEPQCVVGLGHLSGVHAPGLKLSIPETFQIAHNLLKAHGQAVINLRKYAKQKSGSALHRLEEWLIHTRTVLKISKLPEKFILVFTIRWITGPGISHGFQTRSF